MWNLFEKPLPVGGIAPDFESVDETGTAMRLSALRGQPVVLVFYPGDNTPKCRRQLCEFRDSWGALQSRGVLVYGVNPQGAESHRRFVEKHRFPFPILVDAKQRIAKLYRASGLLVKRTVVLIDESGIVAFSKRGAPSPDAILQALSEDYRLPPSHPSK